MNFFDEVQVQAGLGKAGRENEARKRDKNIHSYLFTNYSNKWKKKVMTPSLNILKRSDKIDKWFKRYAEFC